MTTLEPTKIDLDPEALAAYTQAAERLATAEYNLWCKPILEILAQSPDGASVQDIYNAVPGSRHLTPVQYTGYAVRDTLRALCSEGKIYLLDIQNSVKDKLYKLAQ
jgi:hypothetical protein